MRCPTCGETLQPGQERCPTCGTAVLGSPSGSSLAHQPASVKRCPRCGYTGEGLSYFSRPGHIGLLVGVSFFTSGLGGLVYWLARRNHRICARCGLGWEHASRALTPSERERTPDADWSEPETLPTSGIKRRVLGALMILVATFFIMIGFIEMEAVAVVMGSLIGAGGSGTFFWGWKALQARRQALMTGLQRKVLRLATARGGTLTVTQVAADLNLSIPVAEKILIGMDDGFRVRSDITKEGILLYEFPEVGHQLEAGEGSA